MRGRDFERYAKSSLLPRLPAGFVARGSLVFKVSPDNILHGVKTNASSYTKDFYVEIFVQPLYVPSDSINFNFGKRVGSGSTTWSADDALADAIAREAPELFRRIGEPRSLALDAENNMRNTHLAEAAGRSWFACGDNHRAVRALRIAAGPTDDSRDWVLELQRRCSAFADLIERDPIAAAAEQERVVEATRSALRVA
jgi:hypothetical protein